MSGVGQRPDTSTTTRIEPITVTMCWRAWLFEFIGTAILLFVSVTAARWLFGPGSAPARAVVGLRPRLVVDGVVTGATLVALIVSPLGRGSGGHLNPAVSVAFWLMRALPGRHAVAYVTAQLVGSVLGAGLARLVWGRPVAATAVTYAAIHPGRGWIAPAVLAGEAVCLALLMTLVIATMARPALARWTPLVVGVTVAVLISVAGTMNGAGFNPARQFGPALLSGQTGFLWCYLLGPLLGAVLVGVGYSLRPPRHAVPCGLCGSQPRELVAHRDRRRVGPSRAVRRSAHPEWRRIRDSNS
jgi:glycerol uptake facilitator-like aquaporin